MIGRLVRAIRPGDDARPAGTDEPEAHHPDETDATHGPADLGALEGEDAAEDDGATLEEQVFLEPDERILVLLSECDGRMFQQHVIDRTDYSAARVSELLCEMEDEGRINRYWKDGEKVVSFPELGPE